KIGPLANLKNRLPVVWSSSSSSVPVMSLGIRSGVNCTREKLRSSACDTVCTSSVFARPGTPTSSTWPPAKSAATRSSTILCWPTIRRAICSISMARALASWSSNSTSRVSSIGFCRVATRGVSVGVTWEANPGCRRGATKRPPVSGGRFVVEPVISVCSRQREVGALLDRIVRAVERRDRRVVAMLRGTLPRFRHAHDVTGAELLVLHSLREHTAGGPVPHFASDRVDDDDVVRLAVGKAELDVFLADVRHVERESHLVGGDVDIQARRDSRVWF